MICLQTNISPEIYEQHIENIKVLLLVTLTRDNINALTAYTTRVDYNMTQFTNDTNPIVIKITRKTIKGRRSNGVDVNMRGSLLLKQSEQMQRVSMIILQLWQTTQKARRLISVA